MSHKYADEGVDNTCLKRKSCFKPRHITYFKRTMWTTLKKGQSLEILLPPHKLVAASLG